MQKAKILFKYSLFTCMLPISDIVVGRSMSMFTVESSQQIKTKY